ncbi:SGNH/GDSL hydrolase family protein [Ectobacillus sp. sgz5001026]|uniref:SGNH/GDSL hydrolase family protein n=1 Tax=Ectobacillus sp. sgz5001026 TaxID=3242473 RepID=UPI0036D43D05
MSKHSIFSISVLVVCVVVIIFGKQYWDNKIYATAAQSEKSNQDDQVQKQNDQVQQDKESLVAKTWLGKMNPKVAFVGSGGAAGTGASSFEQSWAGKLEQAFRQTNPDVQVKNVAKNGFTTSDVKDKGELQEVISFKPDVIIFELSSIDDYAASFNVTKSQQTIQSLVGTFKQMNPDVRIVFMPSNEEIALDTKKRNGLTYSEYVSAIGNYIQSNGWDYMDYWSAFEQKRKAANLKISNTLTDGIHPNDKGNELIFASIQDYFVKK